MNTMQSKFKSNITKHVYKFLCILEESSSICVTHWTSLDLYKAFKYSEYCEEIYSLQKVKYDSARKLDDELRKLNFLPWTLGDIVICFEFLSLSTIYLIQYLLRNDNLPSKLFRIVISYKKDEQSSKIVIDQVYKMSAGKSQLQLLACLTFSPVAEFDDTILKLIDSHEKEHPQQRVERLTIILARHLGNTLQNSASDCFTVAKLTSSLHALLNKDGAIILLKCIFASISLSGNRDNPTVKFLIDYFNKLSYQQLLILAEFPVECRHLCDHLHSVCILFINIINHHSENCTEIISKLLDELKLGSPYVKNAVAQLSL